MDATPSSQHVLVCVKPLKTLYGSTLYPSWWISNSSLVSLVWLYATCGMVHVPLCGNTHLSTGTCKSQEVQLSLDLEWHGL